MSTQSERSDLHDECNADPVLHVPDWSADERLELERIRDEPSLSDLRRNEFLRSLSVALVAYWFLATLLVVASIPMLVDLEIVGGLVFVAGAFVGRSAYRLTREVVCYVGGPECHHCEAEDARWRASSAPEGER